MRYERYLIYSRWSQEYGAPLCGCTLGVNQPTLSPTHISRPARDLFPLLELSPFNSNSVVTYSNKISPPREWCTGAGVVSSW